MFISWPKKKTLNFKQITLYLDLFPHKLNKQTEFGSLRSLPILKIFDIPSNFELHIIFMIWQEIRKWPDWRPWVVVSSQNPFILKSDGSSKITHGIFINRCIDYSSQHCISCVFQLFLNNQQIMEEIKKGNQNIHRNKWKGKHDNPTPMGFSKSSAKGKVHSITSLPLDTREKSNK